MKELAEGWGIIHPDGHVDLGQFNTSRFYGRVEVTGSDIWDYITPENWINQNRPDCKLVRVKVCYV